MQTATNPQTGEVAVLVGGQWQKAESVASNDSGEKAYLVGGKWMTANGEASLPAKAQQRGFGEELVRQVGLTGRAAVKGATALPEMVGNALGLRSSEAVDSILNRFLPKPESATERVAGDVAGAMSGAGVIGAAAKAAAPVSAVGQNVANLLSQNMGSQVVASGAASGAAGTTREMGGGELAQVGAGLLAGVAVPVAGQMIAQAPGNMIARSIQKSEAKPFAKEGERLARETGIDLSTGSATGNKLVLGLENTARQYGPLADRVQDIDVKIANQAIDRVNKIADTISARKTDPAQLGAAIEDTVKGAVTKLDGLRSAQATKDYGLVRSMGQGMPIIKTENVANELRKLIDENKNVIGADAQKVVTQAAAALRKLDGESGVLLNTVEDAMKSRSFYGKAARGGANVFEDVAPDMNRTVAARLFGAINKDFAESSQNLRGGLKDALDAANLRFGNYSKSIEFIEKSTLGKLVGEDIADAALSGARMSTTAGEAIVAKIASSHPSTRKAAIDILRQHNAPLVEDIKAGLLRDALDKSMSIPPSQKGAGQVPISFNKFISALQGEKVGFAKQLESYGFSKAEIKDVTDTVQAMMRAGDRTGFNTSGTQVQGQSMEIAGALGAGLIGNIKGAASKGLSIAGKYVGLSKIADAMATPEGRRALRTISSPSASPQAAIAAFETIGSE